MALQSAGGTEPESRADRLGIGNPNSIVTRAGVTQDDSQKAGIPGPRGIVGVCFWKVEGLSRPVLCEI